MASTECAYCFRNKYNSQGLYLCMHCNFCTCLDHVNIHQEKTGHMHYLHILYTLRNKERDITAQDRVDMLLNNGTEEIVDLETKIYQFPGRQAVLSVSDEMMNCYFFLLDGEDNPDRTLLRRKPGMALPSPSNQSSIYDQLASSCEHVIEVLTGQPHTQQSRDSCFSSCASCDISNNLWLCLSCGHVGCGRAQAYGEMSGNGHALAHYNSNCDHCVALKLTSLSASVCEAYCYKCDLSVDAIFTVADMRSMLQTYLDTFFGHSIASLMTRTEGAGMSLKQQTERIDELVDRYGLAKSMQSSQLSLLGVLSGFRNTGNTCYASAVISCLRASGVLPRRTKELELEALHHFRICTASDPINCSVCQLYRLYVWGFRTINYTATDISTHGYLETDLPYFIMFSDPHVTPLIRLLTPDFAADENIGFQHDSADYLNSLLDFFRQNGLGPVRTVALPAARRELRCTSCRGHVYKPEDRQEWGISLTCSLFDTVVECEVGAEVSMQDSLRSELAGYASTIDGLRCPLCSAINVHTEAPKVLLSSSYLAKNEDDFPEILIVRAIRQYFDVSKMRSYKLLTRLVDANELKINFLVSTRTDEDEEMCNTAAWDRAFSTLESGTPQLGTQQDQADNIDEQLSVIMDMMIADKETCVRALRQCSGDVRLAVDAILSNEVADDGQRERHQKPLSPQTQTSTLSKDQVVEAVRSLRQEQKVDIEMNAAGVSCTERDKMNLTYKLVAFVLHRGTELDSGHYLAYVRVDLFSETDLAEMQLSGFIDRDKDWMVFNDEEVTLTQDPPIQMAYIYFYKKAYTQ